MSEAFELANPERVTVGTVGPVGGRMFVLQMREAATLLTLKVEKAQVSALARHLGRMLGDLERPGELPAGPELEIEEFDEPDFVVGALGVVYDEALDRIVLVLDEIERGEPEAEQDDDEALFRLATGEDPGPGSGFSARLAMTREQAAALAIRGTELVEAGRPPCPLCGYPLDPRGHVCPRTNGHRPPLL